MPLNILIGFKKANCSFSHILIYVLFRHSVIVIIYNPLLIIFLYYNLYIILFTLKSIHLVDLKCIGLDILDGLVMVYYNKPSF